MISATHFGTCQLCGKQHKAPGNLIAKHGYTLEHGYFSGTCHGSDELPFEMSKDVAETSIIKAAAWRDGMLAKARAVPLAGYEDGTVMFLFSRPVPGNRFKTTSRWERAKIDTHLAISEVDGFQQRHGIYAKAEEVPAHLQRAYADTFRREARQMEGFIEWQTKRCASWAPAAMQPIPNADEGKGFALRFLDGSGYVADMVGRGGWHGPVTVYRTAEVGKAKRYTEKGAKMALGKARGYRTLEVVAL